MDECARECEARRHRLYPFTPSIPSLFLGRETHRENAEACGSYPEAALGLWTGLLVSFSILSKRDLGDWEQMVRSGQPNKDDKRLRDTHLKKTKKI